MNNHKLLASLAVFGELHENKKTIYEILGEFIVDIIKENNTISFTITDLVDSLNKKYEFSIPSSIVKTSLNKTKLFIQKDNEYTIKDYKLLGNYDKLEHETQIEVNNGIINALVLFIKENKNIEINQDNRRQIEKEFCDFILDVPSENGYSDLISAFIMVNKKDIAFVKEMNKIKEGVVLYNGLNYTPNSHLFTPWKNEFTIYINTEHLFHLGGFNGVIYNMLFMDFYNLVKEVNRKKKIIHLKFFSEVKEEVDYFFNKAIDIVKRNDSLDPNYAMKEIISDCETTMDVIGKKINFYTKLEKLGIQEETCTLTVNESNNYKYNIDSIDLEEEMKKVYSYADISNEVKILNYVSLKRADRENSNLENVGYILLTDKQKFLKISHSKHIKDTRNVPLSSTLSFMTNKLWFKLNKGFGGDSYPKSFNVITKAQLLLSSHINSRLYKDFETLKKKVLNDELTEGVATNMLADIRERNIAPEDITEDNLEFILSTLNEDKVIKYIDEKKHFKNLYENGKKNNNELSNTLDNITEEKDILKIKLKEKDIELLEEKKSSLFILNQRRDTLKKEVSFKYNLLRNMLAIGYPLFFFILIFYTLKLGWDTMGAYFGIIFLIPGVIVFSISIYNGYSFDFYKYILNRIESNTNKKFIENRCSDNIIFSLEKEIEELEIIIDEY